MGKRKLSSESIKKYNTDIESVVTNIDSYYTSAEKLAKKIDTIIEDCKLSVGDSLSDKFLAASSSSTLTTKLDNYVTEIKTALAKAEEKAHTDDREIKTKITARSDEVKQLKNIISQYKNQVQNASSLSSPNLNASLKAIGNAGNIDKIPGVVDGRNKRLDRDIRLNKLLSKEQIVIKIKELYRNLTDDELEILAEYYTFKNMKSWPLISQPLDSLGKDVLLLFENGTYRLIYLDISKVKVLDVKSSVNANLLNPSVSSNLNSLGEVNSELKSGVGASASIDASLINGQYGGVDYSLGNATLEGNVSHKGVDVSLGGSLLSGAYEVTFWENDLHKVNGTLDLSLLSGEIGAKLGVDGFEINVPGLIGVGISGNKNDLIDSDTGL